MLKYDTDKSELENKIPDTSGLVKKTNYNTKITELENKIPDISNLATKTALTSVEIKIPSISNSVKKTEYNTNVTEIENKLNDHNHDKYITTSEFNNLAGDVFNARLAGANLKPKTIFDNTLSSLVSKIATNKTRNESIENEFKKSKKDLGDNSLTPLIDYYGFNIRVKFNGSILRQPKVSYTHEKAVNIYIVYELAGSSSHSDDSTLKNCLFGALTLTKNDDIDKYGYSGYGIGFDRKSSFSFPGDGFGQNVIIFGVNMSSSAHVDNKK